MGDAIYADLYVNGKQSSMDEWEESDVDHLYLYFSNLHFPYPLAASTRRIGFVEFNKAPMNGWGKQRIG